MQLLGRRYLGIFIDPVMACNLRCRMCHFTDASQVEGHKGMMDVKSIKNTADALFHRALKLQIGCAAEPTLHRDWVELVRMGKEKEVPYISLTTNGNLLSYEVIKEAVVAGLNEITLSLHGLTKETYEYFMQRGSWEKFCDLIQDLYRIKEEFPEWKIRVNYTVNKDNHLSLLWRVFDRGMDVLQIRPIQQMGETDYSCFDLSEIEERYDEFFPQIQVECKKRKIMCLLPERKHLMRLSEANFGNRLEIATYCYVGPTSCWRADFDPKVETYERYSKRTNLGLQLFKMIFRKEQKSSKVSRKLNYRVG